MIEVEQALKQAKSAGLKLVPQGDKLDVYPASLLTDELKDILLAHKREIISLLGDQGTHDFKNSIDGIGTETSQYPEFTRFRYHTQENSRDASEQGGQVETFDNEVSFKQVLGYRVDLFHRLPALSSLILAVPEVDAPVIFTASKTAYARHQAKGIPVFGPREYMTVCHAAEQGLVSQADFAAWCRRKLTDPSWRLPKLDAAKSDQPVGWTFGQLFDHLRVTLRLIELENSGGE